MSLIGLYVWNYFVKSILIHYTYFRTFIISLGGRSTFGEVSPVRSSIFLGFQHVCHNDDHVENHESKQPNVLGPFYRRNQSFWGQSFEKNRGNPVTTVEIGANKGFKVNGKCIGIAVWKYRYNTTGDTFRRFRLSRRKTDRFRNVFTRVLLL